MNRTLPKSWKWEKAPNPQPSRAHTKRRPGGREIPWTASVGEGGKDAEGIARLFGKTILVSSYEQPQPPRVCHLCLNLAQHRKDLGLLGTVRELLQQRREEVLLCDHTGQVASTPWTEKEDSWLQPESTSLSVSTYPL